MSSGLSSCVQWTRKDAVIMINYFESHSCLWNPKDPIYYNRAIKVRLLKTLSEELKRSTGHAFTVKQLKSKFKNIRTVFGRELKKVKKASGTGEKEGYISKWHHFEKLKFLLQETVTPCDHDGQTSNPMNKRRKKQTDALANNSEDGEQYQIALPGFNVSSTENTIESEMIKQTKEETWKIPQNPTTESQHLMSEEFPVHHVDLATTATLSSLNEDLTVFWRNMEHKLRKLPTLKRLVLMSEISKLMYKALIEEAAASQKSKVFNEISTEPNAFRHLQLSKNSLLGSGLSTEIFSSPQFSEKLDHQSWHTAGNHPLTDSSPKRCFRKEPPSADATQSSLYSIVAGCPKAEIQHEFESEIMIEAPDAEEYSYTSDAEDGSSILPEVSESRQNSYIPTEQQPRTIQNNSRNESNHSVVESELEGTAGVETEDTLYGKYVAVRMGRLNRTQKYRFRRAVEDLLFEMDNENFVE